MAQRSSERRIYYSQFSREWACHLTRATRETRFAQEAERNERKVQANAFTGFSAERAGQSKQLKLASVKNSGWLWAAGVVSSCLVRGPGLIQSRGSQLGV